METPTSQQPPGVRRAGYDNRVILLILWLIAGLLLVGFNGRVPLERTQEARVLQTAREMLGGDFREWLIPHLNGRIRLEKPPLAYWLTATSYHFFGTTVWAGRLPMALIGCFTLALTYAFARRLFNSRTALFSAAALLSSLLFNRYRSLAETDIPVTFFVTAAIFFIYLAWDRDADAPAEPNLAASSSYPYHHLAAVAIALAILAKGPPGLFPLLFLLALAATTRRWRLLSGFLLCGASLTLLAIAIPWFIFVGQSPESAVIKTEASMLLTGFGHKRPFWFYLAEVLPTATLPWIGFLILAFIAAIPQFKSSLSLRTVLLWILIIFLPLTCIGQKQDHYFLPLMPPLMILVGYLLDRAISAADVRLTRGTALILFCTALVALLATPAPLIAAHELRGHITPIDIAFSALLLITSATVLLIHHRKGLPLSTPALLAAACLLIPITFALWAPTLQKTTRLDLARQIQSAFPNHPYAFWQAESLTLSYHLGRPVPLYTEAPELADALRKQPNLIVIFDKGKKKDQPAPPGMSEQMRIPADRDMIAVYRLTSPTSPATQPSAPQ
ncbi:MAG: glycosyltransferase family 39 protein [Planctomycetota bacterium]|nr:glycosyltransferase family 39 protein [Planctomycetota bacterium]